MKTKRSLVQLCLLNGELAFTKRIGSILKSKIHANKLFYPLLIVVCLAWLTTGCVHTYPAKPEISTQSPKSDLSGLKKFYVFRDDEADAQDEKHLPGLRGQNEVEGPPLWPAYLFVPALQNEKHRRALHAVQEALTEHGFPATSGLQSGMPADTEYKVIIHDTWFWVFEWFLLSLDIKFYDVHSGALLASGHLKRAHPSIRRDPEFMANELIEAIFSTSGGGTSP